VSVTDEGGGLLVTDESEKLRPAISRSFTKTYNYRGGSKVKGGYDSIAGVKLRGPSSTGARNPLERVAQRMQKKEGEEKQ